MLSQSLAFTSRPSMRALASRNCCCNSDCSVDKVSAWLSASLTRSSSSRTFPLNSSASEVACDQDRCSGLCVSMLNSQKGAVSYWECGAMNGSDRDSSFIRWAFGLYQAMCIYDTLHFGACAMAPSISASLLILLTGLACHQAIPVMVRTMRHTYLIFNSQE